MTVVQDEPSYSSTLFIRTGCSPPAHQAAVVVPPPSLVLAAVFKFGVAEKHAKLYSSDLLLV